MQVECIYVLPTVEGMPPRALLMGAGQPVDDDEAATGESGVRVEFAKGVMATWSADAGCWTLAGAPLGAELSDAITEHAKSLGVEW